MKIKTSILTAAKAAAATLIVGLLAGCVYTPYPAYYSYGSPYYYSSSPYYCSYGNCYYGYYRTSGYYYYRSYPHYYYYK